MILCSIATITLAVCCVNFAIFKVNSEKVLATVTSLDTHGQLGGESMSDDVYMSLRYYYNGREYDIRTNDRLFGSDIGDKIYIYISDDDPSNFRLPETFYVFLVADLVFLLGTINYIKLVFKKDN